jgi:hypothetical protein
MRRLALAAVAALGLTACTVELEGAPCTTDANCPDSQRCDGAGAQPGRCVACETDPACTVDGFSCAGGSTLRECRTNAGSCRYARYISCGTLTCSGLEPNASCSCLPNGGAEFTADAVQGSALGAPFFPSGISQPPQCRFRSLGDALAAAVTYAAGPPPRIATARAVGRSGGTMVFSGEQFPLLVTPGVTLTTDDVPLVAGGYVVDLDNAAQATAALRVEEDATVSGFLLRPSTAVGALAGVEVSCALPGADRVRISSVAVDGKGALATVVVARGVDVTGPCSVDLTDVRVDDVTGAGVHLASTGTADGSPALSLLRTTVTGAGDTGIQVRLDATPTLRPSLSVIGSELADNSGTQTYGTPPRKAGGALLWGFPPSSLTFRSNRIHDNKGDQVVVYSSYAWDLSGGAGPAACGVTSNAFACYDTGAVGLALASDGTVNALYNSWAHNPPTGGVDIFLATGGTVDAASACPAVPPASCPLPPP